jgi:hypothetical protein
LRLPRTTSREPPLEAPTARGITEGSGFPIMIALVDEVGFKKSAGCALIFLGQPPGTKPGWRICAKAGGLPVLHRLEKSKLDETSVSADTFRSRRHADFAGCAKLRALPRA